MKLGFTVPAISGNQCAEILSYELNKYISSNKPIQPTLFFEEPSYLARILLFESFSLYDIFHYNSTVVCTTFYSLYVALQANKKCIFYPWNLDWMSNPAYNFVEIYHKLCDNKVDILCRSSSHANAIHNNFSIKPTIINDWDLDSIEGFVNNVK